MLPYKSSSHSASTAVTDSLDFQVADAPLQIQFASAKCVRCASLRSGGRRLAVRTAMEHPIGALPRTPFPASRDFPRWEACHWIFRSLRSLTNPVPLPPQGETRKYVALDIVSHMTQTANPVTLLASPLGEEGHEVAKGWTVVRMIMTLDMDVTAERRHYNTHRPQGRYHNPRGQRLRQT